MPLLIISVLWVGLYHKPSKSGKSPQSVVTVTPLGYKKDVEFYSPKYETETQRSSIKPDLRTTIFWKPDLYIIDGTAQIEFYSSDTNDTTYSIVLEGITADGTIIRQTGQVRRSGE